MKKFEKEFLKTNIIQVSINTFTFSTSWNNSNQNPVTSLCIACFGWKGGGGEIISWANERFYMFGMKIFLGPIRTILFINVPIWCQMSFIKNIKSSWKFSKSSNMVPQKHWVNSDHLGSIHALNIKTVQFKVFNTSKMFVIFQAQLILWGLKIRCNFTNCFLCPCWSWGSNLAASNFRTHDVIALLMCSCNDHKYISRQIDQMQKRVYPLTKNSFTRVNISEM